MQVRGSCFVCVVLCANALALVGCGGGGGGSSPSAPPVIESVQATVPPSGGTLTTPNTGITLNVPAGTLTAPTDIQLDVFKDNVPGNPNASVPVSSGIAITFDPSGLSGDGQLDVSLPATPDADDTVYGVVQSGGTSTICPAAVDQAHHVVTLTLPVSAVNSLGRSRSRVVASTSTLLIGAKKPVKDGTPTPRVDLYQLVQIARDGDPDASPSVYAQDFTKNWKRINSPAFGANHIAIVVHGIRNDLSNLTQLAEYLKALKKGDGSAYYQAVYGVNTEWRAGIADNGALLGTLIAAGGDPNTVVDVFAHSQGGLVSRYAIERELPNHPNHPTISRLFTFATPHLGVPLVGIRVVAENGFFNYWPGVADLEDTSDFIHNLNDQPSVTKTDYVTLAGDDFASYLGLLGTAVHEAEGVDTDGIVPVYSAEGALIADHAHTLSTLPVFHLTHSDMRGIRVPLPDLDLDTIGEQRLHDYILGTDVNVGIN